jgi:uncharacterized membrane protein
MINEDLIKVLFAAMMPVGELRLSIPLGILIMDLPILHVFFFSVLGNSIPVIVLIPIIQKVTRFAEELPRPISTIFLWRIKKLSIANSQLFSKYGLLALIILVAVPLPFTGAWTACFASWIFGIPSKKSIPAIIVGIHLAGIMVTSLVVVASIL